MIQNDTTVSNRRRRESPSEKMLEQRLARGDEVSSVHIWGKDTQGLKNQQVPRECGEEGGSRCGWSPLR